jgi:SAM-dependent methyltransferase
MQSLYSNGFEHIYDAMYRTFIDYQDEYGFYASILTAYKKNTILEIGCGTGNLATHFINSSIHYNGLDLSEDMVKLAKEKNPNGDFQQGNITDFTLEKKVDAVLITGRTTSYLFENRDINSALKSITKNLNSNGLLVFDFIDASRFFKIIKNGKAIIHNADFDGIQYSRNSYLKVNKELNNFMFDWKASYYKVEDQKQVSIAEDDSTVRAFTKEEWELLLELNDFEILECIDRQSYAFDTYVFVARSKKNPKL